MKSLLCVAVAVLLLTMSVFAAADSITVDLAAEGEVSQPVTITKTAHVLKRVVDTDDEHNWQWYLDVYFDAFKIKNKGDSANQLQRINETGLTILRSDGKELQTVPVPGQEVKITFTYQMRSKGTTEIDGVAYPYREMEIIECKKIELVGKTLLYKDSSMPLTKDTLIGTVLSNNKGNLSVYTEGGLVYYGDEEYVVMGQDGFEIADKTKLYGKTGNAIKQSDIKPYDRVEIKLEDGIWLESAPPQFAGGQCASIRLLEYGDKWVTEDFETREIFFAVKEYRKNENGGEDLIAVPVMMYERYRNPEILINLWMPFDQTRYEPGTVINAKYLSVNKKRDPVTYNYVSDLKVYAERKLTAEELSGVFSEQDKISLTVTGPVKPTDEKISVMWENKTSLALHYGNSYMLETKKDGKWMEFTDPDYNPEIPVAITTEGYIMLPGEIGEFSYWLYTEKLPAGTYRIATDISVGKPDDYESPARGFWIRSNEFTVK